MFRCDNCGSGYSVTAASSWESCPRCLAREKVHSPLTFELGWRGDSASDPAVHRLDGSNRRRELKASPPSSAAL